MPPPPRPKKNLWNDDIPVNTKKEWFLMVSKWCRILSIHSTSHAWPDLFIALGMKLLDNPHRPRLPALCTKHEQNKKRSRRRKSRACFFWFPLQARHAKVPQNHGGGYGLIPHSVQPVMFKSQLFALGWWNPRRNYPWK